MTHKLIKKTAKIDRRIKPDQNPTRSDQRSPIVTFMGHVDHGKTSLLDYIRQTQIQTAEAGGITQSIGAYQVEYQLKNTQTPAPVTFIDTPGHAAFAQMRARGGQVADIVVLVIAADDGVQPQTLEAINYTRAAGAQMIVALNKIDLKEKINLNKVKKQLADYGVAIKEYGGEIELIHTSAVTGEGIDQLLEQILQTSAELDLRIDLNQPGEGIIIESRLDSRRGPVVSAIVKNGTFQTRDVIVAGSYSAKIRAMKNWRGDEIQAAGPATPIEILGFTQVPEVGLTFHQVPDLKTAQRQVAENQSLHQKNRQISAEERIRQALLAGKIKELNLILKADTSGSLEALKEAVQSLETQGLKLKILHQGVGDINESDIFLAMPVQGIVLGFRTKIERNAESLAQRERIIYRTYDVIYQLLEELADVIKGELEIASPKILGEAIVKQIFVLSNQTQVAGVEVIAGTITLNAQVSLKRKDQIVAQARASSLRKLQAKVNVLKQSEEGGILLKPQLEVQVGDHIIRESR